MQKSFKEILKTNKIITLDGAMATELEKRGVETDNELWSAMALIKQPEAVKAVHQSYFLAGADVATTDSYQANLPAFEKIGLSLDDSKKLVTESVKLAQEARDEFWDSLNSEQKNKRIKPLIAGSIGPYGAYLANGSEYTGDYDLTQEEYIKFHYPRMKLLFDAGVDLFAFETQPNFKETKALVRLLTDKFPDKTAWLTFSVNDKHQLCDTTPLQEAISEFEDTKQIEGIGVNCTSMDNIDDLVKLIRPLTNKPLIVYPNNGDVYDPISKSWQTSPLTKKFADLVPKWIDDGADVIGGCCRTTPEDIAEIVSFK